MFLLHLPFMLAAAIGAALLQLLGFTLIAHAILRGKACPNQCSWLIWSVVATLAAASSWHAGATWPLASAAMNALGCTLILGLALRYGFLARNKVDLTCLTIAGLGLAAWLVTDQPVLGLVLFLGADACGAMPTFRNVWIDPARESLVGWSVLALAGAAATLSVEPEQWAWSWTGFGQWGAAVYVAMVNLAVLGSILLVQIARSTSNNLQEVEK